MTTTDATEFMTAGIANPQYPTTGKDRREVKTMALFDVRSGGRKRGLKPRPEFDHARRIEFARARLRYQEDVPAQLATLYALRGIR